MVKKIEISYDLDYGIFTIKTTDLGLSKTKVGQLERKIKREIDNFLKGWKTITEIVNLKWFEQEINEKEEYIEEIEKEIQKIKSDKVDYIVEHCQYKNIKDNQCKYFRETLDIDECYECATHLSIYQIDDKYSLIWAIRYENCFKFRIKFKIHLML